MTKIIRYRYDYYLVRSIPLTIDGKQVEVRVGDFNLEKKLQKPCGKRFKKMFGDIRFFAPGKKLAYGSDRAVMNWLFKKMIWDGFVPEETDDIQSLLHGSLYRLQGN